MSNESANRPADGQPDKDPSNQEPFDQEPFDQEPLDHEPLEDEQLIVQRPQQHPEDETVKDEPLKAQTQQQQSQLQQQQQQHSLAGRPDPTHPTFLSPSNASGGQGRPEFFVNYQQAPRSYDEVFDSSRKLRPHWTLLNNELGRIGPAGMQHRWKQIQRMVRQNGIAYSAYGDPTIREQHLQLDPLPHLIPQDQWETIDSALQQRAELLNLILADLYGPRTLLTNGVLPTDMLFDHPYYHLPFHDLPTPDGKHLHFYAAELIRSPRGDWWVQCDRTGAPGGSGFALENRIVISRAFPNEFRRCNVPRLAPYFIALREQLAGLAITGNENPNIVILSNGAGSKNYFEDSFLAQYLGFTFVEAEDLVVRLGRVMLKTLGGLTPIDVILRRQPSHSIDPLELGGEIPGVPGILQVIRNRKVVVANAPGSGLVESPIFMAFMPRMCKALLGTDLKLPGIATWWGGEADSLQLMLDRIDDIHLIPAYRVRSDGMLPTGHQPSSSDQPPSNTSPKYVRPETMSRQERIDLLKRNPNDWVGQEKVIRSSAAVWEDGQLRSGYVSMRAFLTAKGNQWQSLPGGLVRISDSPDEIQRKPFEGGGAKDAWVLSEKPVVPTSLLKRPGEAIQPSRRGGFLPSRVAENLCWLGRYLERADASARLLRAVVSRLTSETDPEDIVELPVLIRTLALSGQIAVDYAINDFSDKLSPIETSLPQSALDHGDPSSLRSLVGQVIFLAGTVRDRLSSHAWQIIRELDGDISDVEPQQCDLADVLDMTDTLIVDMAAFSGFVNEFMTRTEAYRFLNIGKRLEHALQIVALIKNCFVSQKNVSGELLESILEISDSALTYRARYFANLQLPAVLDLLLVDELNPRSLSFQLFKLNTNLELLPGNSGDDLSTDRALATDGLEKTRALDIVAISKMNARGERAALARFLDRISGQLSEIFVSISNRFLVHSGPVHQMIARATDRFE